MSPRGGYRKPGGGPKVSGVGKNAKRTDNQPIDIPRLTDAEDLKHGDIRMLEDAVRKVPLGRAAPPRLSAVAPPSSPTTMGGATASELGEHVFAPTNRPTEPDTAGLDYGPGPGSEALSAPDPDDDREFVLQAFSGPPFNNQAAADMLREIQASRAQPMSAPMAQGPLQPGEAVDDLDEPTVVTDLDSEESVVDEEVDQTSVETPTTAPPEDMV